MPRADHGPGRLIIGIVIYFTFGIWNSKLGKGEVVVGHEAEPMELPHAGD